MPDGQERTIPHEDLLGQLGWVQRLARKLAGDANVAADVTQDVWLRTQGRGMESGGGLQRWLRAVTRGLVSDSRREAGRRKSREHAVVRPEAQPSASEVVERNAMQQRVSAAVVALDEPYRSTILYRYMDDLSTAEIAARMSVTEEAVRQRLARARKTLKGRLDREFGGASGAWALAILGAVPAHKFATATSTGFGAVFGVKAAAIGVTVLASVAGWRALGPSEEPVLPVKPEPAAAVASLDRVASELPQEPVGRQRRQLVAPGEPIVRTAGPPDLFESEYATAPFQMW